jgi:hypothetical protein
MSEGEGEEGGGGGEEGERENSPGVLAKTSASLVFHIRDICEREREREREKERERERMRDRERQREDTCAEGTAVL